MPLSRPWRRHRQPRPMSCADVAALVQHYLDGELGHPRSLLLARHLDDCRRCGLDADTYRDIKAALAATRAPVPAETLDRLRQFATNIADHANERQP